MKTLTAGELEREARALRHSLNVRNCARPRAGMESGVSDIELTGEEVDGRGKPDERDAVV